MTRRPLASAALALAGILPWTASARLIDSEGRRCEDYSNAQWQGPRTIRTSQIGRSTRGCQRRRVIARWISATDSAAPTSHNSAGVLR
jgi:hypothetical protein